MKIVGQRLILAIAAIGLATVVQGASLTIFNTGVDGAGNPLSDGTVGDSHYSLISAPGGTTTLMIRQSVGGFPIPPWVGDDSSSAWIGPDNGTDLSGPAGNYDYQTTFNLTGLIPGTAVISGLWSSDDSGIDILINGVSTGQANPGGFAAFVPFTISSGFVSGVNTLDFIVNNQGGPTGLRTELAGSATAAPEPSGLWLIGAGLLGIGMARRKFAVAVTRR